MFSSTNKETKELKSARLYSWAEGMKQGFTLQFETLLQVQKFLLGITCITHKASHPEETTSCFHPLQVTPVLSCPSSPLGGKVGKAWSSGTNTVQHFRSLEKTNMVTARMSEVRFPVFEQSTTNFYSLFPSLTTNYSSNQLYLSHTVPRPFPRPRLPSPRT